MSGAWSQRGERGSHLAAWSPEQGGPGASRPRAGAGPQACSSKRTCPSEAPWGTYCASPHGPEGGSWAVKLRPARRALGPLISAHPRKAPPRGAASDRGTGEAAVPVDGKASWPSPEKTASSPLGTQTGLGASGDARRGRTPGPCTLVSPSPAHVAWRGDRGVVPRPSRPDRQSRPLPGR